MNSLKKAKKNKLKILLLQIRENDFTQEEELSQFISQSGLNKGQIHSLNLLKESSSAPEIILKYDSIWVGGSSDASVLKISEYPGVITCQKMLQLCYERSIPVFASCFGFQVAASQFGGTIILDEAHKEIGTYPIVLNEKAQKDLLLHDMPQTFFAVVGHKERAQNLPPEFINLAYSVKCPYHIFKIKDKPFYGFQFHPEMQRIDLINRMQRYQSRYLSEGQNMDYVFSQAEQETPFSNSLLSRFIERIIGAT